MVHDRRFVFVLSSFTLAALAGGAGEKLVFAPAEKSSVDKVFLTELELSLSDFSVLLAGAEPPVPEMTLDTHWKRTVGVQDEYVSTKEGRPGRLQRKFGEITYEMESEQTIDDEGNTGEGSGSGTSALASKTVRFDWDEGDEEYVKSFVDGEGDTDLLDGLVEDMDLRVLLPKEEVAEGDEWEVEPTAFLATLIPGGNLSLEVELQRPAGDSRFPIVGIDARTSASMPDFLGETATGKIAARFTGTRDEGGRKLAVIELAVEIQTERDAAKVMVERWGDDPTGEGVPFTMEEASYSFELDGEGELVWDLEASRLHSYRLDAEAHLTLAEKFRVDADGEDLAVESKAELEGKYHAEASVE